MPTLKILAPKILAIDDEVSILKLLKTLLGEAGYEVVTSESAHEAMALLEKHDFHCVITDAVMPDLSGYEFVKRLRNQPRWAALPVLMLTRKRDRQDVKQAVEAGVTDYVLKPIDESLLLEKVENCLKSSGKSVEREVAVSGAVASAELVFDCKIVSLGESSITILLHYHLVNEAPFKLKSRIFEEIGIMQPAFSIEKCEMKKSEAHPEFSWEARLSFTLPEGEAARLRSWLVRKKT